MTFFTCSLAFCSLAVFISPGCFLVGLVMLVGVVSLVAEQIIVLKFFYNIVDFGWFYFVDFSF